MDEKINTADTGELKPTVIGETIIIRGEVYGKEDLIVKGRVEGSIKLEKQLIIDNTGDIKADVDSNEVKISGKLKGNISARSRVQVTKEGTMNGDIKSPRVILADGCKFKGNIDMEASAEDKNKKK
jgi:cytoskeletal protein CcmA (bactofilin family)